jgi:ABC-type Mn2+/Zn2+ transport system ATPase subunit
MKNIKRKNPVCYIIAGPNGAGKTTFARKFLPEKIKGKYENEKKTIRPAAGKIG